MPNFALALFLMFGDACRVYARSPLWSQVHHACLSLPYIIFMQTCGKRWALSKFVGCPVHEPTVFEIVPGLAKGKFLMSIPEMWEVRFAAPSQPALIKDRRAEGAL